jgi:hypothetical protein
VPPRLDLAVFVSGEPRVDLDRMGEWMRRQQERALSRCEQARHERRGRRSLRRRGRGGRSVTRQPAPAYNPRRHDPRLERRLCLNSLECNRSSGAETMTRHTYDKEITGLVVIDPYNDFISEGGKIWDRIRAVAEANDCVPHMLQVLSAARKAKLRVFYALHHRYRPGDYET